VRTGEVVEEGTTGLTKGELPAKIPGNRGPKIGEPESRTGIIGETVGAELRIFEGQQAIFSAGRDMYENRPERENRRRRGDAKIWKGRYMGGKD